MISAAPSQVLVVEDDEDTRNTLCDILELDDYQVETASTLAEALSDRDWDRVLAVILDRRLPDGTAEDILPRLAAVAPEAAIIIVTGFADVESAIAALRHGATDYLTKPIQPESLRNSLSLIAARRHAERMFETAINAAPTAMLLVDGQNCIVFANAQTKSTFGYEPDELLGQSIERLIPKTLRDRHRDHFAGYVDNQASRAMSKDRELSALRKDGTVFPAAVTLTAVETSGELLVLSVVEDITQRKKAEALREVQIQLDVARRVQQDLFPSHAPRTECFDIAGACQPADQTGGDYFDYVQMPDDRLGLVVGDASGHGIGPAMVIAFTRAYIRAAALTIDDPGLILTNVNQLVSQDLSSGGFVTLFYAELNTKNRSIRFAAAGHNAHIIHIDGTVTELPCTGMVLGVLDDSIVEAKQGDAFREGDILLLMTDGLWEAQRSEGECFGMERVTSLVHEHRERSADEIVDVLFKSVADFVGSDPQTDDITAVVAKVM